MTYTQYFIDNKDLLYSTGNSTKYSVMAYMVKEYKKEWIHTHTDIYTYVCINKTEKAMAPHSSTLAWKIPWMEEPGRL